MLLTGKCKKEFVKWLNSKDEFAEWSDDFKVTPFSMQYGVYVDFFDSVGIIIDIQPFIDYDENVYTEVMYFMIRAIPLNLEITETHYNEEEFKTLKNAREQVIIKANEIYNSNTL